MGRRDMAAKREPGLPRPVLAIDPGAKCGWAFFLDGKIVEWGLIKPQKRTTGGDRNALDGREAQRVFLRVAAAVPPDRKGLLAVESQFGAQNYKGSEGPILARGGWELLADLAGWEVRTVPPGSWQGPTGLIGKRVKAPEGEGEKDKKKRLAKERTERKARAVALANALAPGVTDDNVADAVLLGRWVCIDEKASMALIRAGRSER